MAVVMAVAMTVVMAVVMVAAMVAVMVVAKAVLVAMLVEMRVDNGTEGHNLRSQCRRRSTRPLHLGRRHRRYHRLWRRCQMWAEK